MESISFKRLTPAAFIPVRSTLQFAGLDLKSPIYTLILPYSRELILTYLQFIIPSGCYGRIAPRSSLSLNNCIDVAGGVIDSDYMRNIGVILVNNSPWPYYVHRGDKIAQFIFEKYLEPQDIIELDSNIPVTNKDVNERGDRGFGSTGR